MSNIKDVAAKAGVSFKTVARVVNKEPTVRESTKQKVLDAIEALNYRPNASAKMMRNQKSGVFGIIMETRSSMAPAVDIIHQAQVIARKHNKFVITATVNQSDRAQAIEQMLSLRVEGIIYATMYHREVEIPKELEGIPTVLVNCFNRDKNIPCVIPNEYLAGFELTQRMLNKGYKRIAFLNLSSRVLASSQRLKGYQAAMSIAGLDVDPDYVPHAEVHINDRATQVTDTVLDELMNLPSPPEALICGKDSIALDCYLYFSAKGKVIGKDIGIGSFDNSIELVRNLKPKLSTMDLPHAQMGEIAMKYLLTDDERELVETVDWDYIEGASF
jgi:LacI family transcriptional regulator